MPTTMTSTSQMGDRPFVVLLIAGVFLASWLVWTIIWFGAALPR